MPTYPARLQAILDVFAGVPDMHERTQLLLDFAKRFREVPPAVANRPFPQDHLVKHCESEAYAWAVPNADGTLTLHFAVENPSGVSAKALAAILVKGLSGLTPAEIATVEPEIVERVFRQNISMGKGMGLMSMVLAVQALARQHLRAAGG
jgi:cysteine desulfuration protein SufE